MASIDEAYLDMTGTERLHGPALRAAHALHEMMKRETQLNCSIGIGTSRLIAKVCSDQAKPNGVLYIVPGQEAAFLAPLDIRKIPGIGKVTEKTLNERGIHKVGDLAKLDELYLRETFGDWAVSLAGKARGLDAGSWFHGEVGENEDPKSVGHEHTFNVDTADQAQLEAMLARLSQMVCRRLREYGLYARTINMKLRYTDFTTITRAHTLERTTQIDTEMFEEARVLFRNNWRKGATIRLIGVQASSLEHAEGQIALLADDRHERWNKALSAADKLRDKFGDSMISLATGLKSQFKERTHENPAALPGKNKKK